jgi:large-conductance mechanosensitive channel
MKIILFLTTLLLPAIPAIADEPIPVGANLNNLTPLQIILYGVFVLAIIAFVFIGLNFILKRVKKLGPLETVLEEQKNENINHNKSISCLHYMDEEIEAVDTDLRAELFQIIGEFTPHILAHLREISSDRMLVSNFMANIKLILSGSVVRNHFTKQLMPETIQGYKARYFSMMEDFYKNILIDVPGLRSWEEVSPIFTRIMDDWTGRIKIAVSEACESKVVIYGRYLKRFEENDPWHSVATECQQRNKTYITNLKV